jgi:hypothetical protein
VGGVSTAAFYTGPLKDIAPPAQLPLHPPPRADQAIIRKQGVEPDFVDYIGTVYRKLE